MGSKGPSFSLSPCVTVLQGSLRAAWILMVEVNLRSLGKSSEMQKTESESFSEMRGHLNHFPPHWMCLKRKMLINCGFLHGKIDWILKNMVMWSPVFLYSYLPSLIWYASIIVKSLSDSYTWSILYVHHSSWHADYYYLWLQYAISKMQYAII